MVRDENLRTTLLKILHDPGAFDKRPNVNASLGRALNCGAPSFGRPKMVAARLDRKGFAGHLRALKRTCSRVARPSVDFAASNAHKALLWLDPLHTSRILADSS